jgi:TolA-binding protein
VNGYGDRDAAPEALFHLGAAYQAAGKHRQAEMLSARLVEQFPESIWARLARYRSPSIQLSEAVP